ncbi:hypothetical protein ACFYS8_13235 [Kitasatospora sp. NPDC004615]|uniref:hypothetical protein n=1 Tax=unclassified Kitasatospora TaxID=2633591 RepID=UPI00369F1F47
MANSTSGGDPRPTPLTDILNEALAGGTTFREIAKQSIDPETGNGPGLSWLNDLAKGKVNRAPEPHTLRALAVGLRLPRTQVQAAAAEQFLEYTSSELSDLPPDARAIVSHLAEVNPHELPRIRAVLEALIAQSDAKSEPRDV